MRRPISYPIVERRIFYVNAIVCQRTLPSAYQRFIDFWFTRYYDRCNRDRMKSNELAYTIDCFFQRYFALFTFSQYRGNEALF